MPRDGRDEVQALLPITRQPITSPVSATEVTKVAYRLKHQVEQVIPIEVEESSITKAHSSVITPKVIETAKEAGGDEYKAAVVYCLLICRKWFKRQAVLELWDADLHEVRAIACEVIAKRIIETEEDQDYLLEDVLLKRFSIMADGEETAAANAVERAVDLHALEVIGSSGYQKCISYLWRGWLVQDDDDPSRFIPYENKTNTSFWVHLDPDRMRVPAYQNALQVTVSIVFLGLYTGAINTINPTGDIDPVEALLYIFTLGFIADEVAKFAKVGTYYISFWNMFNSTLYALLTVSFVTRMVALGHHHGHDRRHFNRLSYNFLAFTAPMFWMRLMLYLDTFRFFGTMLVVVKVMMKESLIFFALLVFVLVGFLQAFIGLDLTDQDVGGSTSFAMQAMLNSIMQSPEFSGFDDFSPPFGIILYYIYTFVITVILLNILIALYNSAYEDITTNAIDEYMALFAQKALQFVRAPDENVFIAPFNLIEICILVIPFEWWLSKKRYEKLNDVVMGVIYSPLLVITAFYEQNRAKYVRANRRKGEDDDDTVEEWEELEWKVHEEDPAWTEKVDKSKPDLNLDATTAKLMDLAKQIEALKDLLEKERGNGEQSSSK